MENKRTRTDDLQDALKRDRDGASAVRRAADDFLASRSTRQQYMVRSLAGLRELVERTTGHTLPDVTKPPPAPLDLVAIAAAVDAAFEKGDADVCNYWDQLYHERPPTAAVVAHMADCPNCLTFAVFSLLNPIRTLPPGYTGPVEEVLEGRDGNGGAAFLRVPQVAQKGGLA